VQRGYDQVVRQYSNRLGDVKELFSSLLALHARAFLVRISMHAMRCHLVALPGGLAFRPLLLSASSTHYLSAQL
jgi:hypothetical protein